ncbi:MAG TPA: hypothetical protein DCE41_02275 [Cytophagales bacterium]|nr:hypothetical protein [Cytophagales bacterium]HAA21916.1 hypothetical protein [Cytophagales bacterium]HAP63815.1 hypothetical protein [Cytophagales bacterium]
MEQLTEQVQAFYETDIAKVYYDTALDTLFLEYTGKVTSHKQFVQINTEVLNAFRQLRTQKFVADIRRMGVIAVDSQQWVGEVLLPGMFEHLKGRPLHHAQFLDEKEIFSKISGTNIQRRTENKVHDGFHLYQFADRQELEDFLITLND